MHTFLSTLLILFLTILLVACSRSSSSEFDHYQITLTTTDLRIPTSISARIYSDGRVVTAKYHNTTLLGLGESLIKKPSLYVTAKERMRLRDTFVDDAMLGYRAMGLRYSALKGSQVEQKLFFDPPEEVNQFFSELLTLAPLTLPLESDMYIWLEPTINSIPNNNNDINIELNNIISETLINREMAYPIEKQLAEKIGYPEPFGFPIVEHNGSHFQFVLLERTQ